MRARRVPFPAAVRLVAERSHLAVPAGAEHWREPAAELPPEGDTAPSLVVLDRDDDANPFRRDPPLRCRVCGGCVFFKAGGGWTCSTCHPKPVQG
jgi:hypothetical protein